MVVARKICNLHKNLTKILKYVKHIYSKNVQENAKGVI